MREAIPAFLQYAIVAWCSVKAHGHLYFLIYVTMEGFLLSNETPWIWLISAMSIIFTLYDIGKL